MQFAKLKKKKSKEKNIFNFVYTWKNVKKLAKIHFGNIDESDLKFC
jgi:hypothetical protein